MRRPPFQKRQLAKFRASLAAEPLLRVHGLVIDSNALAKLGRIVGPGMGVLLKQFTAEMAEAVLEEGA